MFIYFSDKDGPISQHLYTCLLCNKITVNGIKTFLGRPLEGAILTEKIIEHFKGNAIRDEKIMQDVYIFLIFKLYTTAYYSKLKYVIENRLTSWNLKLHRCGVYKTPLNTFNSLCNYLNLF